MVANAAVVRPAVADGGATNDGGAPFAGADAAKKRYDELIKEAAVLRQQFIGYNRTHAEDDEPPPEYADDLKASMPEGYRRALADFKSTKEGRQALKRYRKFWGVPYPVELDEYEVPGPNKTVRMVGLGTTPYAYVSEGPQGSGRRKRKIEGPFLVVADAAGKKVMLLRKRKRKVRGGPRQKRKFLGWVPQTDYVPSAALEKAGTFKRGKYWVHKHDDEGGTWPKAWQDQQGNIIYGPSTLRVDKWMRR